MKVVVMRAMEVYLDAARGDDTDTTAWEFLWGDAIEDDTF